MESKSTNQNPWKGMHGTQRIQKEFRYVHKAIEKQELCCVHDLEVVNNNMHKWRFKLKGFDEDVEGGKQLNEDLQELSRRYPGMDHLLMEVSFPAQYPTEPFFLRLVKPRCCWYTGHVTAGGSICIEALTNSDSPGSWNPSFSFESIILTVITNMITCETMDIRTMSGPGGRSGPLRIDLDGRWHGQGKLLREYSEHEARSAYQRTLQQHKLVGWGPSEVQNAGNVMNIGGVHGTGSISNSGLHVNNISRRKKFNIGGGTTGISKLDNLGNQAPPKLSTAPTGNSVAPQNVSKAGNLQAKNMRNINQANDDDGSLGVISSVDIVSSSNNQEIDVVGKRISKKKKVRFAGNQDQDPAEVFDLSSTVDQIGGGPPSSSGKILSSAVDGEVVDLVTLQNQGFGQEGEQEVIDLTSVVVQDTNLLFNDGPVIWFDDRGTIGGSSVRSKRKLAAENVQLQEAIEKLQQENQQLKKRKNDHLQAEVPEEWAYKQFSNGIKVKFTNLLIPTGVGRGGGGTVDFGKQEKEEGDLQYLYCVCGDYDMARAALERYDGDTYQCYLALTNEESKRELQNSVDKKKQEIEVVKQAISRTSAAQAQKIVAIQRVENPQLWTSYVLCRNKISQSATQVNEQILWHGTHPDNIKKIIEDGFDIRVSNTGGALGWGTYFAQHVEYSLSYCNRNPRNFPPPLPTLPRHRSRGRIKNKFKTWKIMQQYAAATNGALQQQNGQLFPQNAVNQQLTQKVNQQVQQINQLIYQQPQQLLNQNAGLSTQLTSQSGGVVNQTQPMSRLQLQQQVGQGIAQNAPLQNAINQQQFQQFAQQQQQQFQQFQQFVQQSQYGSSSNGYNQHTDGISEDGEDGVVHMYGHNLLILCKVALGNSQVRPQAVNVRKPDEGYHSIQGNQIYCVFDNAQAYPYYLVHLN